jgi:ABC transporter substrate binding protein
MKLNYLPPRQFITLLGGAAAWPLAARAQQPRRKISRIGFLLNVQSELVVALFDGLKEAGYIEGQNIIVEKRFAGNMLDRIAEVANELVALDCDVIFAAGPYAIEALMKATATIPIVGIDLESDPIASGWVVSIARPGRNLTGFFLDLPDLGGKQVELLKEALPTLSRLGFLWDFHCRARSVSCRGSSHPYGWRCVGVAAGAAPGGFQERLCAGCQRAGRCRGVALVAAHLRTAVADRRFGPQGSPADDQPLHSLSTNRRADGLWPELP